MKQRRFNATLTIAALAILLILTILPLAGIAAQNPETPIANPEPMIAPQASVSLPWNRRPDGLSDAPLRSHAEGNAAWQIECVDCPKSFESMTNRSLALDAEGHPHIAYGVDHLYYAWHDGSVWHYETVDDSPGVGREASLALDGADHPHISYLDRINQHLKYAYYDGSTWYVETLGNVLPSYAVISLGVDRFDHPHISYHDNYGNLKYAYHDGSTWHTEMVDNEKYAFHISIALDGFGHPHISYFDQFHKELKYARHDGSTWHIETLDTEGDVGFSTSLALDEAGHPHISYLDITTTYDVKYAYHDGSTWHTEIVDSIGSSRGDISLALDTASHPHISYRDGTTFDVKYAYHDGSTWQIKTVDYSNGYSTSLALDVADNPHITYQQSYWDYDLKYARHDGSTWHVETVDSADWIYGPTSLALDGFGHPHIGYLSYRYGWPQDLKYARHDGSTWHIETVDRYGGDASLVLNTLNYPHISYYSYGYDELRYAYYDGSTWHIETVDTVWDVGNFSSLALDENNYPHISYFDQSHTDLKYAHYDGSTWHIETVDSEGNVGYCTSLALDGADHPHISYWDETNDGLKYAHYNGSTWHIEMVDSETVGGYNTSLALDELDHPHISYFDQSNTDLKYAHYDGTAWHIETVDSEGYVGEWSSLALDEFDHPHIGYYAHTNRNLKYAHYDGTAWHIETVDTEEGVGSYTSLALDGSGRRHISYYDWGNYDLKYAWRSGGPEPTYSISGQVTDADGNPISDVTLSDGAGHTATTDSNGNYTISDLSAGTYTLTPSKSDYTFSPASRTVSVPPSATGQDFTEAPAPPPPLDKPPVVLVHGHRIGPGITRCSAGVWRWEEGSNLPETFGEMARWLKEDGFDVWVAHYDTGLLGTPPLEKNAECLKDQIAYVRLVTGAQQVILIAHSMGGLVSRAYIEGPDYQHRNDVRALITLGSPHAGIPYNWLRFLFGPMLLPSVCKGHEGLCQLEEGRMEKWNQEHGPKSREVAPLYHLIGGDKSDSFLGRNLRRWADPNDGIIGTRSAQAGTDGNPAIQGSVKGRYQTHETHSKGVGYPSYFQAPTGHSQSYQCIQNVILDMSNPCAEPSVAAMLAQAVPSLTEYTSDVPGHLDTGETAQHTLQVDTDGASLFYLSWVTGTLGFTLTNPVGTVIDPAYAAANTDVVTYTTSPGSEMTPPFASYSFTTTVPGLYTATITAGDVGITGTDYLLFAAMETTRTLSVALDSNHYQIGDTAVLTATLEGAGGGITGATVQATFSRSDAITDTLTLTDQGDGTYRGTYAIPNAPGYLHLHVTAEGSDAGTQFNRQVDRLLTVASPAVQLTGTYADRADDADGNGRYETLTVDVEVLAVGAGDFTFSADLVAGEGQFVAHVITQTALITGTQSVSLRFDGELIQDGGSDGPFTVTNLLISDPQNAGIPSVMADDVWTTAAYDHTQFGRIPGDMNGDCIVTVVDIMLVASRWGTYIGDIRYDGLYDLDNSGNIDIVDIMIVATHWRERCER